MSILGHQRPRTLFDFWSRWLRQNKHSFKATGLKVRWAEWPVVSVDSKVSDELQDRCLGGIKCLFRSVLSKMALSLTTRSSYKNRVFKKVFTKYLVQNNFSWPDHLAKCFICIRTCTAFPWSSFTAAVFILVRPSSRPCSDSVSQVGFSCQGR